VWTTTFCVLLAISVAVMGNCYDAFLDGENFFRSVCLASVDAGVSTALYAVDRKSMGHALAELSWKDADFLCISCI
jgi:hypothetical protein